MGELLPELMYIRYQEFETRNGLEYSMTIVPRGVGWKRPAGR